MAVSEGFLRFVLDQLRLLGKVTSRRMFGGAGLYRRGLFFGILFDDLLYLKVDGFNRADYLEAKMEPFRPFPNRSGTMQYYRVPADVLEDPRRLSAWAEKSLRAAAAGGGPRGRPKRSPRREGRGRA